MINVWKFCDSNRVKLTDTDGNVYIGDVVIVDDAEETGDPEDGITIYAEGRYLGFLQSEIADIKEL